MLGYFLDLINWFWDYEMSVNYLVSYCRKNPRGVLISPGPGNRLNLCCSVLLTLWLSESYLTKELFKNKKLYVSFSPGTPQDSGISLQTVLELGPTVPLFGVCMGLQCMGEAFGGESSKMSSSS